MPIVEPSSAAFEYPLAIRGINCYKSPLDIAPNECALSKNMIYRNGMVKRPGSTLSISSQVVASKAVVGLHRFYYGQSSKQTLAVAGTAAKYWDGAAWQNIKTGLTDSKTTHITTWQNKAYFANSTDIGYKWDGATLTDMSTASNPPVAPIQFLPYADRMLVIENTNTGASRFGALRWSYSYDDGSWYTASATNVKPDSYLHGMCYHSSNNIAQGYGAKVLLAGSNGMYLFSGNDLSVTGGDYTISPLSIKSGCNAPRTMQWTPKGTIWLGSDKVVYLLPFNQITPIPISRKIFSTHDTFISGIEDTPNAYVGQSCAVYHDGWYMLSVTVGNGTYNTQQWWLDVNRLEQDEAGEFGPWYGPMTGQNINVFASQSGNGDGGELIAGEANPATGANIYEVNRRDMHADNAVAIPCVYRTFYNPMSNPRLLKNIERVEIELLDSVNSVNLSICDIEGALKSGISISLSSGMVYWGDAYWGVNYWSDNNFTRKQVDIQPILQARRIALELSHSSNDDKFELLSMSVQIHEQSKVFDERA